MKRILVLLLAFALFLIPVAALPGEGGGEGECHKDDGICKCSGAQEGPMYCQDSSSHCGLRHNGQCAVQILTYICQCVRVQTQ